MICQLHCARVPFTCSAKHSGPNSTDTDDGIADLSLSKDRFRSIADKKHQKLTGRNGLKAAGQHEQPQQISRPPDRPICTRAGGVPSHYVVRYINPSRAYQ